MHYKIVKKNIFYKLLILHKIKKFSYSKNNHLIFLKQNNIYNNYNIIDIRFIILLIF